MYVFIRTNKVSRLFVFYGLVQMLTDPLQSHLSYNSVNPNRSINIAVDC